jgi:hypothetical protein
VVGDLVDAIVGDRDDGDSGGSGRGNVDVVEADAVPDDPGQPVRGLECTCANRRELDEEDVRAVLRERLCELVLAPARGDDELRAGRIALSGANLTPCPKHLATRLPRGRSR